MAPKSSSTVTSSKPDVENSQGPSTRITRSSSKLPKNVLGRGASAFPTPADTTRQSTAQPRSTRSKKRTISDSQEDVNPGAMVDFVPVTKKTRTVEPLAPPRMKKAAIGVKRNNTKIANAEESNQETTQDLTAKAASENHGKSRATPSLSSLKRKASADIPIQSIEASASGSAATRRSTRSSKRVKTETVAATIITTAATDPHKAKAILKAAPKAIKSTSKSKSKAKVEEEIDFNMEHVATRFPPQPVINVTHVRTQAFQTMLEYEYRKNRDHSGHRSNVTLMEALVRKSKAAFAPDVYLPPPPVREPPRLLPPAPAPEELKKSTLKPISGAITTLTAVDQSNILESSRRTRNPKQVVNKLSSSTTQHAANSVANEVVGPSSATRTGGQQPTKKQRKRKERAAAATTQTNNVEEEEPEEPWPAHPPLCSRTPSPYPGEEREPKPEQDEDPDDLYAPSILTTIPGPDGNRYREFRRTNPETEKEEVYWIRVPERK
ncbi:uncharacterized protein PV09_01074 [Verruconis gallopava]|uniref:Uncharacterized protein n=1 Tax=Verruconis gallopava TaxID=253628 RepID=A0A0D1Z583_9PEZI|nr:uncharacterized protein PV09_01074 [Verruconis gallopava]KIW08142.1 hypothetical protein PV09_01074 [Verruconis gallopava]